MGRTLAVTTRLHARLGGLLLVLALGWMARAIWDGGPRVHAAPTTAISAGQALVHHDLQVVLEPDSNRLSVEDTIALPRAPGEHGGQVRFLLHAGLRPVSRTAGVTIVPEPGPPSAAALGLEEGVLDRFSGVPLQSYRVLLPAGTTRFTLTYGGVLHHPVVTGAGEQARGFGETAGTISPEGIFLAGGSAWVPWLDAELLTFELSVRLPPGWDAVSQGTRTSHARQAREGGTAVRWDSPEPQEEVYLVAGPFVETSRDHGPVRTMAFLREADPALAERYLEAAGRYLSMYSALLGPHPYGKFAVVENFWETGYGMPSFTLLGPAVLRLPFIVQSSYPHEILHDWWGNGVYVDPAGGNWSEGLTAYLADHLFQEQQGTAVEYRQTTLQKYGDYVSRTKDFPLETFRARHDPASEAIGYGKAMTLFHTLRLELGDDAFVRGLRRFYEAFRFRRARFQDLRVALEQASGRDLRLVFADAITRTGATRLAASNAAARRDGDGWILSAVIRQTQDEAPFLVTVPVAVTLEGRESAWQQRVRLDGRRTEITLRVPARPIRIDVDPEFDVFRKLDFREVPPALSGAYGTENALVLLPSDAGRDFLDGWRKVIEAWDGAGGSRFEVRLDRDVAALPSDRSVWVLGWENRFRTAVVGAAPPGAARVGESAVRLGSAELPREDHAFAVVARNPARPDLVLAWVAASKLEALPGLARKLPHYHKYSYVAFEGDEPVNVAKGRWAVSDSPMTLILQHPGETPALPTRGSLVPRQALASAPPAFSTDRMLEAIRFLGGNEMRGRGFGTPELARAAEWIAAAFREAGLQPGGDAAGSFFQSWQDRGGDPEGDVALRNVIGVLPGSKPEWAGQSVVVAAHYDHLGLGWPDARAAHRGAVHPGADDNASGVAVLIELARRLAGEARPERTIVFAAFTAEEAGRRGSKRYVAHETRSPAARAIGMVNLDTVGRLGPRKVIVLGTGSAREWIHIVHGAGHVSGVPVEAVASDPGGSDQVSFLEAGVPAVQLFAGAHPDYHTPRDTVEGIDGDGLAKVAAVAREIVAYLASRPEPLTGTTGTTPGTNRGSAGAARKASLGTIPDFAFPGPGVRLAGVVPESPAERAGLRAGDVVLGLEDAAIDDLRALARALDGHRPGDRVKVRFSRDGTQATVQIELTAR